MGTITWPYTSPRGGTSVTTSSTVDLSYQYVTKNYYQIATDFIFNGTIFSATLDIAGGVLQADGTNWNTGNIAFGPVAHTAFGVIRIGQTLVNYGTIDMGGGYTTGEIQGRHPTSTLTNFGTINFDSVIVDTAVTGIGKIILAAPHTFLMGPVVYSGSVEFDKGVNAGQTINMNMAGTLMLRDLPDFHAVLTQFSAPHLAYPNSPNLGLVQSTIDLIGRPGITGVVYHGNQSQGALTVYNSAHAAIGTINFVGDYTKANFSVTHTGTDSLIRMA